jgi:TRAP-type C4-dicarboxylate transport system permease small subunit
MKSPRKIIKTITDFFGIFVVDVSFIVIFITFLLTIFSRYIFKQPITWSYEISVLGYIWTMFFGVGKAMEHDEHVVFGLVYDKASPKVKLIFLVFYNAFLIVLLLLSFYPCLTSLLSKRMVTGVLKLPFKVVFAPFIYMLADIAIRSAINIRKAFQRYASGELAFDANAEITEEIQR